MTIKRNTRILSALLAVLLFLSCCPMFSYAELFPEGFHVAYEGEKVTQIEFYIHEKKTVTAENLPEGSTYQWQIQIPGTDTWVDIQGQTNQELGVSYALVGSLLDEKDSGALRCAASGGSELVYTDVLTVTLTEEPEEITPAPTNATEPTEEIAVPEDTEAVEETVAPTEVTEEATVPAEEQKTTAPTEEAVPETTAPTEATEATEPQETIPEAPAETETPKTTEAVDENTTEPTVETAAPEETEAVEEAAAPAEATGETTAPTVEPETATTAEEAIPETTVPAEETEYVEESQNVSEKTAKPSMMMFASPRSGEETDIVCISIHYIYWDRETDLPGDETWSSYNAYIQKGTDFEDTIPNKVVPGCKTELAADTPTGVTLVTKDGVPVTEDYTGTTSVKVVLTNVQNDVNITVYYKEIPVPYHARYFMQNIYNDLYVEDTSMTGEFWGFPGADPQLKDEDGTPGIYKEIIGFSPLFHQPDVIAADGSTVFEVYYDRNYYLMNFDLKGGYGTAPVYARYGTAFNVSQPEKPGYVFNGWELKTVNGVAATAEQVAASFPVTIPAENRTYLANWKVIQAPYTLAYWIENADGTRTYLGSRLDSADSGTRVSGDSKKLTATTILCDHPDHSHAKTCFSCDHTHKASCAPESWTKNTPNEEWKWASIAALDPNGVEDDYLYILDRPNDGRDCYIKLGDQWYGWSMYDVDEELLAGRLIKSATLIYEEKEYKAYKHQISGTLECGHNHDDDVLTCNAHMHSEKCYVKDFAYMEYVSADSDVLVNGDGSTVVNVYYRYKEYKLKFYYAMSSGSGENIQYYVIGGTTWPFGSTANVTNKANEIALLDYYMTHPNNVRGEAKEKPELNANGKIRLKSDTLPNGYQFGEDKSTVNGTVYTYYYLYFTARFNDDIHNLWPCDVFESVTMKAKWNATGANEEQEAMVSAWNGEHHVLYSQLHDGKHAGYNNNQTIKGNYERLDEYLLWASQFGEPADRTVTYLCFWENGATAGWNKPELYRYNIYLEALPNTPVSNTDIIKQRKNEDGTVEYVRYYLDDWYDTCDNSTVHEQTQVSIQGFTARLYQQGSTYTKNAAGEYDFVNTVGKYYYDTFEYENLDDATYDPNSIYDDEFSVNFYYDRIDYKLVFQNHDGPLTDGGGSIVPCGMNLRLHGEYVSLDRMNNGWTDPNTNEFFDTYPETLEPNAYTFTGWYTTPQFLDGTRIDDWDMEMPASDKVVYAKWEPITHDVYFYMDFDQYKLNNSFQNVQDTKHGEKMNIDGLTLIPSKGSRYIFTGWFYIDESGNKVAFNPAEMAVRKDLHLYAEWTTGHPVSYTVYYVLGDENGDIIYQDVLDENGNPVYTSELDADGNPIVKQEPIRVADDTNGYGFEATTRTIKAKPGNQLNLISSIPPDDIPDYGIESGDVIWLPNTNSHSILLKAEDENGNNPNVFTFIYTALTEAPYTVKYLDITSGEPVKEEVHYPDNKSAVVTEKFSYVEGYIPDSFHKTLILSANENENVITFYYTKDDSYIGDGDDVGTEPDQEGALYKISHWIQDLDDPNTFMLYVEETEKGIVGNTATATVKTITGYTYVPNVTLDGKQYTSNTQDTITKEGLELNLYYTRCTYNYVIHYLEHGSDKVLKAPETKQAFYQKVVQETGPNIKGYELYTDPTQNLTISYDETMNVITFYYTAIPVMLNYKVVLRNSKAEVFGKPSRSSETPDNQSNVSGAQAIAEAGFRFVAWYEDEACTRKIADIIKTEDYAKWFPDGERRIVPQVSFEDDVYNYTYYALFEPITLTISHTGLAENETAIYQVVDKDGKVVATVALAGNGEEKASVTIEQIPAGDYTVTELTDWTWKNGKTMNSQPVTVHADPTDTQNKVSFTYTRVATDWLHGETHCTNNFAKYVKPDTDEDENV